MTCYYDPKTGGVFDHEGTAVGTLDVTTWSGDFPNDVLGVLYDAREDGRSEYNQELLFCMAGEQIEIGTPPDQS